jgi:hypothetical protein
VSIEYLELADSALHAPAAGFGDTEFSLDFVDKAAVLIVRLSRPCSQSRPAEMERLTSGDVSLRIKDAVRAAQPGPDAGSQFDQRSGNVVDEGIQVGQEAIASDDPGRLVVAPGA